MSEQFVLETNFRPTGDQPQAIAELVTGVGKATTIKY